MLAPIKMNALSANPVVAAAQGNNMFKPFYVHLNKGPGKMPNRTPRGFTAKVSPHPDDPRKTIMQGTFCSPKDEFNKKQGRATADKAVTTEINRRDVPRMLAAMAQVCGYEMHTDRTYLYVLKNMV